MLAFALFEGFAGNIFWGSLANFSAVHATVTKVLANNPPQSNPVNSTPPQDNSSVRVIDGANGSKTYIYTFVTVSRTLEGFSAAVSYETVIVSPYWFFLGNAFDLMRYLHDQIAFILVCAACALELSKRAEFPKVPPP